MGNVIKYLCLIGLCLIFVGCTEAEFVATTEPAPPVVYYNPYPYSYYSTPVRVYVRPTPPVYYHYHRPVVTPRPAPRPHAVQPRPGVGSRGNRVGGGRGRR